MAQKGDGDPVKVKAFVCQPENRDPCGRRSQHGFEPARIRLEAYLRSDAHAVDMQYGLVCAGEDEPRARSVVDLSLSPSPVYTVEHRDIGAGDCYGSAILYRRDGSTISARSEMVRILSRE